MIGAKGKIIAKEYNINFHRLIKDGTGGGMKILNELLVKFSFGYSI
jgi:hypothetical protein